MARAKTNQNDTQMNEKSTQNSNAQSTQTEVNASLTADSIASSSQTQIAWQRSEDGSYSPSSYIHRELSLLDFNKRVLAQAASPLHPLLERLFFLIIFSSNMDEFFEIRVAGLMQKLSLGGRRRQQSAWDAPE